MRKLLCIGLSCLMLLSACGKFNSQKDEDNEPKVEAKIENCQLEQYIDNFDDLVIKIQEGFNSTDLIITDSQKQASNNDKSLATLKHFGNGDWYLDVDGVLVKVFCNDKLATRFLYYDGKMDQSVYVLSSNVTDDIGKQASNVGSIDDGGSEIPDPKPRETIPEPNTTSEELSNWYIDDLSTDEIVELVLNLGNYEEPRQGETFDDFITRLQMNDPHLISGGEYYDSYYPSSNYQFTFQELYSNSDTDRISYAKVYLSYKREMDNSITKTDTTHIHASLSIHSYEKATQLYESFKNALGQYGIVTEKKLDLKWRADISTIGYVYLSNESGKYTISVDTVVLDETQGDPRKAADTSSSEGCVFPNSSTEEISEEEIKKLTDEQLRYAINEIWARHGYIFSTPEILKYYRQFDWYEEKVPSSEWNKNGQNYYLNDIEKTNINRMTKERDSRGYQIGG